MRQFWNRRLLPVVALALALAAMALGVAACGGGPSDAGAAATNTIVGAGASFPYPLYSKWGEEYAATGGAKLNYQSIGSGGGISAVKARTVDFGASDAPLEETELSDSGLVQFPICVGGVVPVVNLEGVADGQLKLTADLLAKIYNGRHHDVERPRDHRGEQRRHAAGRQDQRRPPLGQLRHHLDLHALPRGRRFGRLDGRRRQGGPLADRRGRQGQRGRRRERSAAERLHRLRGVRLRQAGADDDACRCRTRTARS